MTNPSEQAIEAAREFTKSCECVWWGDKNWSSPATTELAAWLEAQTAKLVAETGAELDRLVALNKSIKARERQVIAAAYEDAAQATIEEVISVFRSIWPSDQSHGQREYLVSAIRTRLTAAIEKLKEESK